MENYFKRAKPAPITDGAVFNSDSSETGISGGWLEPKNRKYKTITATFVLTGFAALAGILWANRDLRFSDAASARNTKR